VKKIILFVLTLCLFGCVSKQQEIVDVQPDMGKQASYTTNNDNGNSISDKEILQCKKIIRKTKSESELYQEKSDDATDKKQVELAAIYTELASAKTQMAAGMEGILNSYLQAKEIYAKNPELMKNIINMNKYKCIILKKNLKMDAFEKKLEKLITKCENNAVEADGNGNENASGLYSNMEGALSDKLKAVRVYSKGKGKLKYYKGNLTYYIDELANYEHENAPYLPQKKK
jgi:hypothetical protein